MELRGIWLFLILMVRSIAGESLYYKVPKDHDPTKEIRGNSFGLENFLLQAYKEADAVNVNENVPVKRLRDKQTYRKPEPTGNRGETYGLEMLTPNIYNFGQSATGLSQYITDFKPVVESQLDFPKRRLPVPQTHGQNDQDDRRERNKIRKPVKQVVRRPVTTTKAPNTMTQRVIEPDIVQTRYEQEQTQDQQTVVNEAVAAASFAVAKTQEIPVSDKDADDITKQRPRKRVTMRRRRKRPQTFQNSDNNAQANDGAFVNEANEAYEIQKELDYVPSPTTTTTRTTTAAATTTARPRTDKERPSRRRAGGFGRMPADDADPTQAIPIPKTEYTTVQYRNDAETNEANSPTEYTPEVSGYAEEPSEKPTTITYKPTTTSTTTTTTTTTPASITSTEETSAADLKTFLKQQNGPLSLSELLQTQNLSLADFLKNRKEAALILSGRRGIQSTTVRPDSRESRPSFNTKSRPFSRRRPETEGDEYKSAEGNKSIEVTTAATDRYTYNGFVPKNPRGRNGHNKIHPTYKPYYGSEEKSTERRTLEKDQDKESTETSSKRIDTAETFNHTRGDIKGIPKRFNDMRLKLRIQRRKYNPHSTTKGTEKDEKIETSTIPVTTNFSTTQTTPEKSSTTTEENPTTKRVGLRIPFKSSNNPELSLILPSKNKTEEKPEKRERYSNYASRVHGLKKSSHEKDDSKENNTLEQSTTVKGTDSASTNMNLPLDAIDFDDEKDMHRETGPNKTADSSKDEKDKNNMNKHVEVVGKIPLPNEVPKYEPKDEILELLKPGSSSERLQRILESRNMTVKELLENREKSSLQTNFTQFFHENDTQKRNDVKATTTTIDPNFKVFQSLPDFEPIHRNLFQKNVKEVKSNSYPSYSDIQNEESRPKPIQSRMNTSTIESRGSKQFHGVMEVKKRLQLNSDSESRDTSLETNDGVIDRWNTRDKVLYYNNAFPKPKLPTARATSELFPMNNRAEDEVAETDIILLETIRRSQEANQKLKSNINEILQEQSEVRELNNDLDKSFIPPAVKSAIIASGIVMGLALFVFVAIFAACGWKQRQIRLRARSSILNDALAKSDSGKKIQRSSALSPVNFKQSPMYKKTHEMDEESSTSASLSSNASSYLWNTLKNTFAGRNSTLKNRLDKEDKMREERLDGLKSVLRNQDNRRSDLLVEDDANEECFTNSIPRQEGRYSLRKNDCAKSPSFTSSNHFSSCTHGHK